MDTVTETPVEQAVAAEAPRLNIWIATPIALLIALAMSMASLHLFTVNNDFPLHYHPDESSKVEQIEGPRQMRNFNHPLLLVEAGYLMNEWIHRAAPRNPNLRPGATQALDIVISGRDASAALAAIGVFALAMAGFAGYGFVGLFICGSVAMLCPPLLVYAHYFKEDTALVCGIMVAILGARLLISAKNEWTQMLSAIVLGAGCAAAMSGKYVGAITAIPCVISLALARNPNWPALPMRVLTFLLATMLVFVAINQRMFVNWKTLELQRAAEQTVEEEYEHGTTGHSGIALPKPNSFCLEVARAEIMPHLYIFGAIGIAWMIYCAAKLRFSEWRWAVTLGSFLVFWIVALAYSPIPFGRYALPITICGYVVCAHLIAAPLAEFSKRSGTWGYATAAVCLAVIIAAQGARARQFNDEFLNDSRQLAREWVAKNLPRNARIVIDGYTSLAHEGDPYRFPNQAPLTQYIITSQFAGEGRTVRSAQAEGIEYVAVAKPNYERFLLPGIHDSRSMAFRQAAPFVPIRDFYLDLFNNKNYELVKAFIPNPDSHSFLNPEIRIYKISGPPNTGANQPTLRN